MVKLTKAIIKKYGISKKAWAVARGKSRKRPRKTTSSGGRKTARRRYSRRRRPSRRSSNKWGVAGTVLKLAVGAYLGNWAGGQIMKYVDPEGTKPLYRAGGAIVGAIAAKKLLGKSGMGSSIATGAAAVLAGGAAMDFMTYMKARQNGNGT